MNQTQYQYINLDYLNMMTEDDAEMQKEILHLVVAELQNDMPKMLEYFKNGDLNSTHQLSHKFKTTLAFVGNPLLSETNKEAELITKTEKGLEQLPALFKTIEELHPKVLEEMKIHLDSL